MGGCFFFFQGTLVLNMVWTLLGPPLILLCCASSSSPLSSSSLLLVTWELIRAHCLKGCLNSWNASRGEGEAGREEAARGAVSGDAQMCLLSKSSQCRWRIRGVTCSWKEKKRAEATNLPSLCYSFWLVRHLFVFTFWTGTVPFLKLTTALFFLPYDDEGLPRPPLIDVLVI